MSYHVVYEDPAYGLPILPAPARRNVRKGLAYARVEPIPLARLAAEGWSLRLDTLGRQGRMDAEDEAWWQRLCLSAEDLPGFEAWGAIHDGELVASLLSVRCDGWWTLLYVQSASAHRDHRTNNALYFSATQEALRRPGARGVFLGLDSLDAPESVDQFKFRMGYTAKPVRQRVVFHPLLAPLVGRASHGIVKRILARYPQHSAVAKAEGMVRFCLEGRRPASEQDWPECLSSRKSQLLAGIPDPAPSGRAA